MLFKESGSDSGEMVPRYLRILADPDTPKSTSYSYLIHLGAPTSTSTSSSSSSSGAAGSSSEQPSASGGSGGGPSQEGRAGRGGAAGEGQQEEEEGTPSSRRPRLDSDLIDFDLE